MQNPLSGFWTAFLTDPKYSNIRHAITAGLAVLVVGILQAVMNTNFGGFDPIIAVVAGFAIKWLSSFTV